jgi:hypothetical protein
MYRVRQKIPTTKIWLCGLARLFLSAILLQFFANIDFAYHSKIKKHNFHEASNKKVACNLPLFFRGATINAYALPKFFVSPCNKISVRILKI